MTLLIKNVQLVDGVHDFPERSDVFVANGKISAIGNFPAKQAATVIDGQGCYLSPGFIDVNTDSDHYLTLFAYPSQADFLKQGVTTIFGGMCGSSLAPLLYGTLEGMEAWASAAKINVGWHTMKEFLASADRAKLGVNFGTLVGHATVRRAIAGDESRELTKNERQVFERMLKEALQQGAFGLSTGLGYLHGRKTSSGELAWLLDILKKNGGVYATHLRDGAAGVEESITETIRLAKGTAVKTLVSHFIPFSNAASEYAKALDAVDALPASLDFRFDLYPFEQTMVPFSAFLPVWAQGDEATMTKSVQDEWLAPRILKEMTPIVGKQCIVVRAPGHEFLVGKTLAEIAAMYDVKDFREAFLRLCAATSCRGTMLYRNLDKALTRRALASARAFVASNAPGFDGKQPGSMFRSLRTTSTFPRFLALAEEENLLPLKAAVRKLSYESARFFDLPDRGELKEGAIADLTSFTKSGEIKFTVVGGAVAVQDGEFTGVCNGKALRRKS